MITVRMVLIGSVVAVAVYIWAFFALLDPGKPSNRDFKRAGSREAADAILRRWGAEKIALARRNLAVDWTFIAVYSTMWISAGLYFAQRTDATLRIPALLFTAVGLAGAVFDVCENTCLWFMLHGNQSLVAPRLCAKVMVANVACFFVALAYFAAASAVHLFAVLRH